MASLTGKSELSIDSNVVGVITDFELLASKPLFPYQQAAIDAMRDFGDTMKFEMHSTFTMALRNRKERKKWKLFARGTWRAQPKPRARYTFDLEAADSRTLRFAETTNSKVIVHDVFSEVSEEDLRAMSAKLNSYFKGAK